MLGCAIALALSVWARKPHEVILATYVFWLMVLMAWPVWYALSRGGSSPGKLGHWTLVINPFYLAFAPYSAPGRFGFWDYAVFFAAAIVTSGMLVLLAVWRMRPVTTRQASEAGKEPGLGLIGRMGRWLPGPSLDGNPVLWREWHRSRPSLWMTILVAFLGGTTGLACCIGAFAVMEGRRRRLWHAGACSVGRIFGYLIQLILGLLMLSVLAPLSMSEERQRGSLDVLIATPLSTWCDRAEQVVGDVSPGSDACHRAWADGLRIGHGSAGRSTSDVGRSTPSRSAHGYPICGAALVVVTILAHGAAMTSIGLALATWIKRQVRAIVTSVCVFVLVAVAWPILVSNSFRPAQGMASLSPIFVAARDGRRAFHAH